MSTGTAPALPVEIIAEIVDEVATNRDWLVDCSIVSRTWRVLALHHLFWIVSLYNESRLDSLAPLLHANASLVTHIRHVNLKHMLCADLTLSTLPTLCNVHTIRLHRVRFACDSTLDESLGRIAATFPRVTRLFMTESSLCPTHDMPMRLFAALPHLRHLDLRENMHLPCETMPAAARSPWVCELDTLSFLRPGPASLDWFAEAWKHGNSTVEKLVYRPGPSGNKPSPLDNREYRDSLSAFMRTTTTLRSVELTERTMEKMATLLQAFDLSAHKHLRKLNLRCRDAEDEPPRSLVSLIQAIRKRSLHADVVKLSLWPAPAPGPWDLILEALSRLSSADETAAEFVLELDERVFMITSLATLEQVLGAIA